MFWFKENPRLNLWLFTIYSWNVMCPVIFRLNNRYGDQWQVTGFIADVLTPSECPSLCFLVSAMICSERICCSFYFLKYRFHKRPAAWFCFINNLRRWSSLTATEYVWVLRSQVGQIMAHSGRTNYTICKLMMGINLSNNPFGCS